MSIDESLELIKRLPELIDRLEAAIATIDSKESKHDVQIGADEISLIIKRHKKSIPAFKSRYPLAPIYQEGIGCKYYAFKQELQDWVDMTPTLRVLTGS